MVDQYTTTLYATSALWIAAIAATAAGKLVTAGTWKQGDKVVWYVIVAT
jgi:hypothetical protein